MIPFHNSPIPVRCSPTGAHIVKGDCTVKLVLPEPQYRLEQKKVLVEGVCMGNKGQEALLRVTHIQEIHGNLEMCLKFLASGSSKVSW